MSHLRFIIFFGICLSLLASCYNSDRRFSNPGTTVQHDSSLVMSTSQTMPRKDSLSSPSLLNRHYDIGYNFVISADSLPIIQGQPEECVSALQTDTLYEPEGTHIVVADMRIMPQDEHDSVWIQIISEHGSAGWIHESTLLKRVTPSDPISQMIMLFSHTHVTASVIIIILIAGAYAVRIIRRRNAPLIHFRDIPSFYPTLLCITVASSATFYASLQMYGAEIWQHFYYHPSLNPFQMPPILSIFIMSVWAMLIIGIAVIDDTRRYLNTEDTLLYLLGLIGLLAILYIVFSISTLYYVGYPLLAAYCWLAINRYMKHFRKHYICGNCGAKISQKGKCPVCGAVNT